MGASFEHDPEMLDKMHEATLQALANAQDLTLEECVGAAQKILVENKTNNTGALGQSIQVNHPVIEGGDIINGSFGPQGPNSGYAGCVENGTKPHFLPKKVIQGTLADWVRLRGLTGSRHKGKGNEAEAESIAWAIANAISKRGTRPQPFLIPAWQQCKGSILKYIQRELAALKKL